MTEHKRRLEGKVAIVTGAGSRGPGTGNGKATATLFAREGAKVLLVDLFADRAEETLKEIKSEGGTASVFAGDMTKVADCQKMAAAAVQRFGKLDILHNNVGIDSVGTVVSTPLEEWDHVMEVNLKSVVLASRFAIPQMVAGGGGAIINISSVAGLRPRKMDAYTTSKGAVITLTQAMAFSHAQEHVRVNCIMPGPVYTPMVAGDMSAEKREGRRLSVPLQTEGTAWDIAWAAVFLASDEARWITGAALPVDGGALLTRQLWAQAVQ
jgi:NAD(P)-dependent dehydrogenase (short-subunit alcohol dehydrogenase family)